MVSFPAFLFGYDSMSSSERLTGGNASSLNLLYIYAVCALD